MEYSMGPTSIPDERIEPERRLWSIVYWKLARRVSSASRINSTFLISVKQLLAGLGLVMDPSAA